MSEEAVDDAVLVEIVKHRHICPHKGCGKTFRCANIGCLNWETKTCDPCYRTHFLKRAEKEEKE